MAKQLLKQFFSFLKAAVCLRKQIFEVYSWSLHFTRHFCHETLSMALHAFASKNNLRVAFTKLFSRKLVPVLVIRARFLTLKYRVFVIVLLVRTLESSLLES